MNISDRDQKELTESLQTLNKSLRSPWVNLGRGMLRGFGSVLGAGLAIILIGWFLNIIGVIPAFQKQAEIWRQTFVQVQNQDSKAFLNPEDAAQSNP